MSGEVLIRATDVGKRFCRSLSRNLWYGLADVAADLWPSNQNLHPVELRKDEFWANQGLTFEVKRGECLGLIGANGAGKTTLLKQLSGLVKPDVGRIEITGQVGSLIALGAGFNPILTGRENVFVNGSVLGLSKARIRDALDDIVSFAELDDFIDAPVGSYSSGMQVRLGFAVATTLNPDVLILDEILAVGDRSFRSRCYSRLAEMKQQAAVVFVSHNLPDISRVTDNLLYLAKGQLVTLGPTTEVLPRYLSDTSSAEAPVPKVGGTFRVRCNDLAVLSLNEAGTQPHDQPLAIRFDLEPRDLPPDQTIELVVTIRHADGSIVVQNYCTIEDLKSARAVRVTSPPPYLNAGEFFAELEIRNFHTGEVYHLLSPAFRLVVARPLRYAGPVVAEATVCDINNCSQIPNQVVETIIDDHQ